MNKEKLQRASTLESEITEVKYFIRKLESSMGSNTFYKGAFVNIETKKVFKLFAHRFSTGHSNSANIIVPDCIVDDLVRVVIKHLANLENEFNNL